MITFPPYIVIWIKNLDFIPYCIVVGLISFIGAYTISLGAEFFGINLEGQLNEYTTSIDLSMRGLLIIMFVAPIAETILLCAFVSLLIKSKLSNQQCCVISALVWGALHGLLAPIKFLTATWTFYLFSISYVFWKRKSLKKGLIAAAIPHIILNTLGMAIILLS
ncbi:CPBP family glutamic-type intramembrane protease [Agaribacter marinus]|uniref:CPBP family glutamic-type intramembrane protease n=1 Tax=Agaribacter marinus TaxID=1431249 RepID=UPI0024E14750|nr:CPBP family glutamic-type intramembrane protease [Agaribacter marinus]